MNNIEIKVDEQGKGFLFYNGLNIGNMHWDNDTKQFLFTPYGYITLDCDQLAEIAEKIGWRNSYGIFEK
ncbi:hypothetical protein D3C87_1391200 [compost metagenome]